MDRRSFIAYSSLATIGAALSSSAVASTIQSFANSVQLPTAAQHVRHGMCDLKAIRNPMLPKWITVFEPHQFLKNGFNATKDDLNLMQFNLSGQAFSLGFDDTKAIITSKENTQEISFHKSEQILESKAKNYSIRVLSGIEQLTIENETEILLFVLKGDLNVNDKLHSKSDFIHLKYQELKLHSQSENLAVLITKGD